MRRDSFFISVFSSLFLLTSAHAAPARLALLAGGSGERGPSNFFVEDFKSLKQRLVARGWKIKAAIGPKRGLVGDSVPATNANILKLARETLTQAHAGDEALIVLHTHGRERESIWGQKTHSLVSEDLDPIDNDPGFDLDDLEPLLIAAKARGVKIGLVDLSCYSGTTQAIQGPSCTVTLSAPDYTSVCSARPEERTFSARFFEIPKPGTAIDLESQYLSARRQDRESTNLPQISSLSTPGLSGWNDFLKLTDPLDIYGDLHDLRAGAPGFDAKTLLTALDTVIAVTPVRASVLKPIRASIADALAKILSMRRELESTIPKLAKDYDEKTLNVAVPGRGTLTLATGWLSEYLEKISDPKFDLNRTGGYSQAQRGLLRDLKPVREKVERDFQRALVEFKSRREAYDSETLELEDSAGGLLELERDFYEASLPEGPKTSQGCRQFAL